MTENIKRLKTITEQLPDLAELVLRKKEDTIEYECDGGTCIGIGLFKNGTIAVQRAFLTDGTVFPEHSHEKEIEILIVYEGSMEVRREQNTRKYKVGEPVVFQRGEVHSIRMIGNVWLIGITIPASEDYPDA
jgi:quercetin dioxygenase-like cupin family protein